MASCLQCDLSKPQDNQPFYNSVADCQRACNMKACKALDCTPQHPASGYGYGYHCAFASGGSFGAFLEQSLAFVLIAGAYVVICAIAGIWKAISFKTNLISNIFIALLPILVCVSLGLLCMLWLKTIVHMESQTQTSLQLLLLHPHRIYAQNSNHCGLDISFVLVCCQSSVCFLSIAVQKVKLWIPVLAQHRHPVPNAIANEFPWHDVFQSCKKRQLLNLNIHPMTLRRHEWNNWQTALYNHRHCSGKHVRAPGRSSSAALQVNANQTRRAPAVTCCFQTSAWIMWYALHTIRNRALYTYPHEPSAVCPAIAIVHAYFVQNSKRRMFWKKNNNNPYLTPCMHFEYWSSYCVCILTIPYSSYAQYDHFTFNRWSSWYHILSSCKCTYRSYEFHVYVCILYSCYICGGWPHVMDERLLCTSQCNQSWGWLSRRLHHMPKARPL